MLPHRGAGGAVYSTVLGDFELAGDAGTDLRPATAARGSAALLAQALPRAYDLQGEKRCDRSVHVSFPLIPTRKSRRRVARPNSGLESLDY